MAKLTADTIIITELSSKLYNVNPRENIDELPNNRKLKITGVKNVRTGVRNPETGKHYRTDVYALTYARKNSYREFWVDVEDVDSRLKATPKCNMDIVFSTFSGGAIYIV